MGYDSEYVIRIQLKRDIEVLLLDLENTIFYPIKKKKNHQHFLKNWWKKTWMGG
jgi:hypothetical protein